ncbi:MAG: hypothetical protein ACF8NJ_08900 [Phycisphaerales bacterium JB038]
MTPTSSSWCERATQMDRAEALPGLGSASEALGARLIASARLATAMHQFEVARECGGGQWGGERERLIRNGCTEAAGRRQGHADARMPGK